MNIPIVYEDKFIIVVNKPSGLLCVPTPKKERRTLTSILSFCPCHRLDRETSGLVIYAKTKVVQQKMMDEFRLRQVKKKYIAFLRGTPAKSEGEINYPIENQQALTKYKVIQRRGGFSVVEVTPLTGRTNQIRIHFSRLGLPILGETKYAFRRDFPPELKAKRLCLHAQDLEFKHPVTGNNLFLHLDLEDDLKKFLETHE